MGTKRKASGHFRKRLRDELTIWQGEGLLRDEQAAQIRERYDLDDLKKESIGAVLLAVYIIGAFLIAIGIVSFIASHWASIPAGVKVAIITAVMLACHIAGFWLWRVSETFPRLGHGLIILGTLVFGANIGLLAQIFHLPGDFNWFGAFAIGAAAVAYAAVSMPNALIAVIASFVWYCGWCIDHERALALYPLMVAAVFLGFAYWRRSILVFLATILAIGISILVQAVQDAADSPQVFVLAALGVALLYMGWAMVSARSKAHRSFAVVAGTLGILALAATTYIFSFHEMAEKLTKDPGRLEGWNWVFSLVTVWVVAGAMWAISIRSASRDPGLMSLAVSVLAAGVFLAVALWPNWIVSTVAANLSLVCLIVGLIWSSVAMADRRVFLAGIILAGVLVASRFFEYETGLLWKSVAFLSCGVTLIASGVRFETYLRRRRLVDAS